MKKNIAIVAGGDSGEYEISINSAEIIHKEIDREKYNPFLVIIKGTKWLYIDDDGSEIMIDKNDFSLKIRNGKILFDCVFIAIHGIPGEDGKLQGYFDLLRIPYTSCDLATSAITFNKSFCKGLVKSFGILTAKSVHLFKGNPISEERILEEISLPCFVKPNNGGSSVGMSRVNEAGGIIPAIEKAFKEDDEVLIEDFIEGVEITCGVVKSKGVMTVFPLTEIVTKKEFFDYEAKYVTGMAEEIVPARVSGEVEKECKTVSAFLYNSLNCKGLVRFDYIIKKDEGAESLIELFFLEVNTVPGLSASSIVPKMAQAIGMSNKELYTKIIEDAIWRGRAE